MKGWMKSEKEHFLAYLYLRLSLYSIGQSYSSDYRSMSCIPTSSLCYFLLYCSIYKTGPYINITIGRELPTHKKLPEAKAAYRNHYFYKNTLYF